MQEFREINEQINEYKTSLQSTIDQDNEGMLFHFIFIIFYRNWNSSLQTNIPDALPLLAVEWTCLTKKWRVNKNNLRVKSNEVWDWVETHRTGIIEPILRKWK